MNNNQQGNDWFRKGNSLYEAKRFEEAIHCYDQAVKFDPSNVRIWNNRGLSFDGLGQREEAIFCYTKALEINPKYVAGWCNRGISLNALRRYKDAIQCFYVPHTRGRQHCTYTWPQSFATDYYRWLADHGKMEMCGPSPRKRSECL